MLTLRHGIAAGCLLLGMVACQSTTSPRSDVSREYILTAVDGDTLPCCGYTATGGRDTAVSLAFGDLALQADGSYYWTDKWEYNWQDDSLSDTSYTTLFVDSTVSVGRYTLTGSSLILQDSVSAVSITASLDGDSLALAFRAHWYAFVQRPPPLPDGLWNVYGCHDPNGGSSGCPRTDSTGATVTETRGLLEIAYYLPSGRYEWQHLYDYHEQNGDSTQVEIIEDGNYAWDGTTVTFVPDSSGRFARGTGTLQGYSNLLTVRRENTVYSLARWLGPPDCVTRVCIGPLDRRQNRPAADLRAARSGSRWLTRR